MKARHAVLAALVLALCAACAPKPPAQPTYHLAPEYCPYDSRMVQFNGDSVGAGYAHQVRLPEYSLFNASQGAGTWTISDQVPTITTRVQQWIDQCGVPGAVVIEGGFIDLTRAVSLETLQGVVLELSDWLEARGVPTIWVAVHPIPYTSNYMAIQENRIAYNDWLTSSEELWGTAVDCTPAMEQPERPGTLHRSFWSQIDIWGNFDGIHPNTAGYEAMARCVEPVIREVVGTPEAP
jgi:lysophospholipase L1-like esterase